MPEPWNSPGVGGHIFTSLFRKNAAMKLHISAIPDLFFWGLKFLRNSTPSRHLIAAEAVFALASCSVRSTDALVETYGLQCDYDKRGTLKIFESEAAMNEAVSLAERFVSKGQSYKALTAAEAVEMEPQLGDIRQMIAGAIHYPNDRVGDAHLFTRDLAEKAIGMGAKIRTGVQVGKVRVQKDAVVGLETSHGFLDAGCVIICAGNGSVKLAQSAGVHLPIKPVKGYSITFRVGRSETQPRWAVIDDAMHAAIVPLGDRMRVVGVAEFAGLDGGMSEARVSGLVSQFRRLYPALGQKLDIESVQPWTNFRPMSADGAPFIGPAGPQGLWINAGHGYLGWTMAAGSAAVLADLMERKTPAIDPTPYRADR